MEQDRNLLFALTALQLEYIDFDRYTAVCAEWSADQSTPLAERLVQRNWLTKEQRERVEHRLETDSSQQGGVAPAGMSGADAGVKIRPASERNTEHTLQGDYGEASLPGDNIEQTLASSDESGGAPKLDSRFEETIASTGDTDGGSQPGNRFEETIDSSDQSASRLEATQDMDDDGSLSEDTQSYGFGRDGYVPMETVDHSVPADERTRYTFTKMHGEGGIGRVWLARDQHLNREIALKEIRPDKEQSKTAWKRFVREAQITSQLEHPNIIPVYELSSQSSDQGWFYTMRFVRGDTFRQAIDDYHRHRREGKTTELELRALLTAFVAVCRALGYAHSRGVLHRDLKPSNIMLGAFGEVVVLDWGLAKMVNVKEDEDEDLNLLTAGPVAVTSEGDLEATQQGAILGTLPYMAPEQAAGRLDKVDSRTDIYGLGAILYAILTGNHPHKGTTTREVRSRIIKEPTPRVRHEDKSAHPVLDAICGKAMAKERPNRYAKAGDLADDVERWLADEPVSCHKESRVTKLARWLRRHKTWAQSIASALLVVTLVSLVAVLLINRARNRTVAALEAEQVALTGERVAKQVATERFEESRETVDEMLTGVSDALRDFPGMQSLRHRFLEEAARKYEGFAVEDATDAALQLEAARSLLRLGDIHLELDSAEGARKTYREAATRLQDMIHGGTGSEDIRLGRVTAWQKLGALASRLGEQEEALGLYDQALEELADLIAGGDPDGRYRFHRAGLLVNQASILGRSGDSEQARRLLQEAIATFESLVEAFPDDRYVDGLAKAQVGLGVSLRKQGRNSEAIVPLQAAAETFRQLGQAHPNDPRYIEHAATTRLNLAAAFRTLGRDQEERQAYRSALADYELLVADRPDVPLYQQRRALTKIDLGMVLHFGGDNREAAQLLMAGIAETQQLLDTRLGMMAYYEQVALGQAALGRVFGDLGDEQATAFLGAALDGYDELIVADPALAPSYQQQRAATQTALGLQYWKIGEVEAARSTLLSAMEEFKSLADAEPNNDALKNALARSYTHLGDFEWDAQQEEIASQYYGLALSLRESLDREPEHRYAFVKLLMECRDPNQADIGRATKLAAELVGQVADNPRYATALGAAYYRAGRLDDAVEQLTAVDRLSPQGGTAHELWLVLALAKIGGEQSLNRAKNRLESAVDRMDLDAPAQAELARLRAEAEAALKPLAEQEASEAGIRGEA